MTRLTLQNLLEAIEKVAEDLLTSAGADKVLSREDLLQRLEKEREPYRSLLEAFYNYLRDSTPPRMRITRAVINDGVAFVKNRLLPQFEISPTGLSEAEQKALSALHPTALRLGAALKRAGRADSYLSPQAVFQKIAENTNGLFFDYLGSESSEPIEAVFIAARLQQLTPETFSAALNLNPDDPSQVVERFVSAAQFFADFVGMHYQFELQHQAAAIADVMRNNLIQNTIIVLGRDNDPAVDPQHPAYVVGLADDGSLIGFKSQVIWT